LLLLPTVWTFSRFVIVWETSTSEMPPPAAGQRPRARARQQEHTRRANRYQNHTNATLTVGE
jgi:hypothetical protein